MEDLLELQLKEGCAIARPILPTRPPFSAGRDVRAQSSEPLKRTKDPPGAQHPNPSQIRLESEIHGHVHSLAFGNQPDVI